MANSNDLADEVNELVIEDKNWNNLPFEMKEMVVREMDSETRTRLKMCSKADKYLVESIRMSYPILNVYACGDDEKEEMILDGMLYRDENENNCDLHLQVIARGNIASITKENEPKQIQCSSYEDAKNMVKRMFFNVFFDGNLRFEEVTADIVHPNFMDNSEFTIRANEVTITSSSSQVIQWLNNVAPGVKSVTIHRVILDQYLNVPYEAMEAADEDTIENIGNIPAVVNADVFNIYYTNDINDDQLLTFKCTKLEIGAVSNITAKGINQLIKKVIANDYPKESCFEIPVAPHFSRRYWNEMIDGLDIEMTKFQDAFDRNDCVICIGQIKMNDGKVLKVSLRGPKYQYKDFRAQVL